MKLTLKTTGSSLALITLLALTTAHAQPSLPQLPKRAKTDIIHMQNGDQLTGEIKELQRGKMTLKTSYMGTVYIEWKDVDRVESTYEFQFEEMNGDRVTGTISDLPTEHVIIVEQDGQEGAVINTDDIVRISQIEDGFLARLNGSLSFGYSFTKASDIGQGNFSFNVEERTEKRSIFMNGSTIVTDDGAAETTTRRADLQGGITRFLKQRWFRTWLLGFETNDELQLDLRTRIGGGLGRFLVQTNRTELSLLGGALATRESQQTDVESETNLEGYASVRYAYFVFDEPKVNVTASMNLYPSFTQWGRIRSQFDLEFRWELLKDLYWDVTYYSTRDSDPPSGAESTRDYGTVTSLSWTF